MPEGTIVKLTRDQVDGMSGTGRRGRLVAEKLEEISKLLIMSDGRVEQGRIEKYLSNAISQFETITSQLRDVLGEFQETDIVTDDVLNEIQRLLDKEMDEPG